MRKYTATEIKEMKPKMKEMLDKSELGLLLPFREIIAMSDEKIETEIEKVNELLLKVPLMSAEIMRKKYDFDIGIRSFDEKLED